MGRVTRLLVQAFLIAAAATTPVTADEWILFSRRVSDVTDWDIYKKNITTQEELLIHDDGGLARQASWSPSGYSYAFCSDASSDNRFQIFVSMNEEPATQITDSGGSVHGHRMPRWRSENEIWFYRFENALSCTFYRTILDGSTWTEPEQIPTSEPLTQEIGWYCFSDTILFYTYGTSDSKDVYSAPIVGDSIDFAQSTNLTSHASDERYVTLSHDASRLLFTRGPSPVDIWIMNTDGTDLRKITSANPHEIYSYPLWMKGDSTFLCTFAVSDNWDVISMDTAGQRLGDVISTPETDEYMKDFRVFPAAFCCVDQVGNVNADPASAVNLTDLTVLVNSLFVTFETLPCPAEANTDGDPNCILNLTDLTVLVNHLFVTFEGIASCGDFFEAACY